jgi:DNA mismatch repair ATPase MutS
MRLFCSSGQSFGLHCAAAAGLPQTVISGFSRSIFVTDFFYSDTVLIAGARNRLQQLQSGTARQSTADVLQLLQSIMQEEELGQLLQVQNAFGNSFLSAF